MAEVCRKSRHAMAASESRDTLVPLGLYYPWIHFPNDEWVKLAALYWSQMNRIVPDDVNWDTSVLASDSEAVKALTEAKFIKNREAGVSADHIHAPFVRLLEDHQSELVKRYGIAHAETWPDDQETILRAPHGNPKLRYIYSHKISGELSEQLQQLGLGSSEDRRGGRLQWVGMHPKLFQVYMAALASDMAAGGQLNTISSEPANFFAASGLTYERLVQVLLEDRAFASAGPSANENEATLATIAIRSVMPVTVATVPVEQILEIREDYAGEMDRFQSFVKKVIRDLRQLDRVTEREFVNDHLDKQYTQLVKPKVDELEDKLRLKGMDVIETVLNIKLTLPAVITEGAKLAGMSTINPIVAATGAVALGLTRFYRAKQQTNRKALAESDVAYLVDLNRSLKPRTALTRLTRQLERVM
jgi:hypothetical protein